MKNFKNLFLVAVAALIGFSSCNDSITDPEVEDNGTRTLAFTMHGAQTQTRQVGPQVEHGSQVEFLNGTLLLSDAGGNIVRFFTISDAPSTIGTPANGSPATNGQNINIGALTGGSPIFLEQIPATVRRATLVGNSDVNVQIPGNIGAINSTVLNIHNQLIEAGENGVNLYATNQISMIDVTNPHDDHTTWSVALNLDPTLARLELTDMTIGGTNPRDGFVSRLVSYDVTAIFLDGFYRTATISGATNSADWVNREATNQMAEWTAGSTWFPTTSSEVLFDEVNRSITVENPAEAAVITPSAPSITNPVWGYNVFATATAPRLVIRLENVVLNVDVICENTGSIVGNEDIELGTQFIVVSNFTQTNNGPAVSSFLPGNVYRIGAGSLWFDERNMVVDPNETEIDLRVEVTISQWNVIMIEPGF